MSKIDLSTRHSKYSHIPRGGVLLNAIRVNFSGDTFALHVESGTGEQRKEREAELGGEWLVKRRGNDLHGIARCSPSSHVFGTVTQVLVHRNLLILASRLEELVSEWFEAKESLDGQPLSFLGKDLLSKALDQVRAPDLAYHFSVRTRFDLKARIIKPSDDEDAFVALTVNARTKWQSDADLEALKVAGVNLRGLYVLRRDVKEDEHRVAGRIERLEGPIVILSDSPSGLKEINAKAVQLEPRLESFARALSMLLGSHQYKRVDRILDASTSSALDGPALENLLSKIRENLISDETKWQVAPNLTARFGSVVALGNRGAYKSLIRSKSVSYYFNPGRSKQHTIPWKGLSQYGPFDQESFPRREPRLLVICTDTTQGTAEQFVQGLIDGVGDCQVYAGMRSTFSLPNIKPELCVVPWLGREKRSPGEAYRDAIEMHLRTRPVGGSPAYDATIVVINDEHSDLPSEENPYLWSKALLLQNAIPVQQLKFATAKKRDPYAMQNIATALYAKMSGTPWTVAQDQTVSDELVIGLGMSEQGGRFGDRRRLVGITTVFRGDGNYLLGYLAEQCDYDDYPEKLRQSTLHVLRRQKDKNGWRPGDTVRIVYHSYQRMRDVNVERIIRECVDEVGKEQRVEFAFLTVTKDHPFSLLDIKQVGKPAGRSGNLKAVFLPDRGIITQVGRYDRLLTTLGPHQTRAGEPLKKPVLITLHKLSTYKDLTYLSEQVLKFTSLSWRTVRPVKMPVTIRYSKHIATQLADLSRLDFWSPASLNTQLGTSLWFL